MFMPSGAAASADTEPLTATMNTNEVSWNASGAQPCSPSFGTSGIVTCVAAGGLPPYTYDWQRISVAAQYGPYIVNSQGQPATNWRSPGVVCDPNIPSTEVWECTVTDALGREASDTVDVRFTWVNSS